MALGRVIVRQLELNDRGTVLERWLAHHLAELIAEADQTVGPAKSASEAQAVDRILKLWVHRRALPEPIDPLGGYRKAVDMLGRLVPEANPWARFRRPRSGDELLHEMFQLMSRIVVAGLVLTHVSRSRPATAEESNALEEEELYLQSMLEQWMQFIPRPDPMFEVETDLTDTDAAEGGGRDGKLEPPGDYDDQKQTPDEQGDFSDVRLHATIVANLERMQTDLATLLTRWRESPPCEREGDGEDSTVPKGAQVSTITESMDDSGSGESVRDGTGADPAEAEATRPEQGHSFWSSLSLAELAEAQGVAPVEDLDGIADLWPADDNPDEVLAHVLAERAARRRAVGSDPQR